jgi:hypothetical protein
VFVEPKLTTLGERGVSNLVHHYLRHQMSKETFAVHWVNCERLAIKLNGENKFLVKNWSCTPNSFTLLDLFILLQGDYRSGLIFTNIISLDHFNF